ncbi:MAG: flagellar hook-associated protein FlgL [Angelakisella sp.]
MRITQRMMTRGYIDRMSGNLSRLSASNRKLSSGTKYTRVSENTAEVARAFEVREKLYRNEQYTANIESAQGELSSAESNLMIVNGIMQNVQNRLLQGDTGTLPASERKLIANELKSLQQEILQISNAKFGEKYTFAGSGTGKAPFDNAGGVLTYHGYEVDKLEPDPTTGRPSTVDRTDPAHPVYTEINFNKDIYVDVGLGMTVAGSGVGTQVDTNSVVKLSTSGMEAFGFGVDPNTGMPNNVYSLLSKTIADMENGNFTEMDRDLTAVTGSYDRLLVGVTDVGTRSSFLDDTLSRLDGDSINLKTTQQKLEAVPLEEEMIYNKTHEMSWMVTLQLGSKIIPPSIFDFLR